MMSETVTETACWGKLGDALVIALGRSPYCGAGLGTPFFPGSAVAQRAAPTRPPVFPAFVFSHPVQWDAPLQCGFLMSTSIQHRIGVAVVVWLLALGWTASSWALTV